MTSEYAFYLYFSTATVFWMERPDPMQVSTSQYSSQGSRLANCRSLPLPPLLEIQSCSLIPSSSADHLVVGARFNWSMTFGMTSHMGMVFSDMWPVKNWGGGITLAWRWKASDTPIGDLIQSVLHLSMVDKEATALLSTVFVCVFPISVLKK